MARRKPDVRIRTWGIYRQWDPVSKQLPKIAEVTARVPAKVDIEFGMVVNIKWAKNRKTNPDIRPGGWKNRRDVPHCLKCHLLKNICDLK